MSTKIQQWGNSLGVRIPKSLAQQLGITSGAEVTIEAENNTLKISPLKNKETIESLCAEITETNKPKEAWGEHLPVGNEVW